ncbi:MAG: hypothetical protein M1827_003459 [Pycnora praestabilis]|nr:MAG: hypothetical protein M1827_003459 [Pycnora praestabilis]
MADSDGDYIEDISDGDPSTHQVAKGGARTATRSSGGIRGAGQGAQPKAAWEDIKRSWENVVEGADGTVSSTVEQMLEAGKRKRLLKDTTPVQRGIIRHMILVLDLSTAMAEKDLRPTRYLLTCRYVQQYVTEFFEQNPISQLGIIGMRDGLGVRISDMSGNPNDHIGAIQKLKAEEPKGHPSLQNALDMARAALFHAPSHGTREVLIVYGALLSSDPGDVHQTINALVTDKIRVSVVGLAARVAICVELCTKTNAGDGSTYGVALNEEHFHALLFATTTPPITRTAEQSAPSLLMTGFPSRIGSTDASLCACHSKLTKGGYLCPRCSSKVCALPTDCPACGLTLILSTHLARSYHHLFPLRNWVEVSWQEARKSQSCFACQTKFPQIPEEAEERREKERQAKKKGTSVSSRTASLPGTDMDGIENGEVANGYGTSAASLVDPPPSALPEMRQSQYT